MIDVPLYDSSNFIGAIPFFSATDSARKCTQILFWINVNHSSTRGCGTRVVTLTTAVIFSIFTFYIFHFRA
ncbi:hypothetical protein HMPREF9471_03571, partial [[Clostridium] clostridioforme WAL-7855]